MIPIVHFFYDRDLNEYCYDTASNSIFQVDDLMKQVITGNASEELLEKWDERDVEIAINDYNYTLDGHKDQMSGNKVRLKFSNHITTLVETTVKGTWVSQ